MTRVNNSNIQGMSSVIERKTMSNVYPQIGHFFSNIPERRSFSSPDEDKDADPLLVNLFERGNSISNNLKSINLASQSCYRDIEPINLYHKVGHGTLDMYVISPGRDSKEVREFLQKWHNNDQSLFQTKESREFQFPLQNLVSICALLVWQPANPNDTITRILFPGSTPDYKILEGLDKIKHLEFMKQPICTPNKLITSISSSTITKKVLKSAPIDKPEPMPPSKSTTRTNASDKENKSAIVTVEVGKASKETKSITEPKVIKETQKDNRDAVDSKPSKITPQKDNKLNNGEVKTGKGVQKDNKESFKDNKLSNGDVKTGKAAEKDNRLISETKPIKDNKASESKSTIKSRIDSKPPKSMEKRIFKKDSSIEKKEIGKSSPTATPKKTADTKIIVASAKPETTVSKEVKDGKARVSTRALKASPSGTPAKSTKDANNRKVLESKQKATTMTKSTKKESTHTIEKKEVKAVERKPISRRPKPGGESPVKAARPKTEKEAVIRRPKLDKSGVSDSSVVSTPTTDDAVKSKDTEAAPIEEKQVLDDLQEEAEAVKEIEAVLQRSERRSVEEIGGIIVDIRTVPEKDEPEEEEEYIIIEKEEIDHTENSILDQESNVTKEEEIQKHQRDSQESEKQRKASLEATNEKADTEAASAEHKADEEPAADDADEQQEKANDIEQHPHSPKEKLVVEATDQKSTDATPTSPADKIGETKPAIDTKDAEAGDEPVQAVTPGQNLPDSQPFSGTIESGATTAPTLPEDERMPLDEIKEDIIIEEKHVKEETKEIQITQEIVVSDASVQPIHTERMLPIGIQLEQRPHLRDIIKTPDEVADLPVHEEADMAYDDNTDVKEKETVAIDVDSKDDIDEKSGEITGGKETVETDEVIKQETEQTEQNKVILESVEVVQIEEGIEQTAVRSKSVSPAQDIAAPVEVVEAAAVSKIDEPAKSSSSSPVVPLEEPKSATVSPVPSDKPQSPAESPELDGQQSSDIGKQEKTTSPKGEKVSPTSSPIKELGAASPIAKDSAAPVSPVTQTTSPTPQTARENEELKRSPTPPSKGQITPTKTDGKTSPSTSPLSEKKVLTELKEKREDTAEKVEYKIEELGQGFENTLKDVTKKDKSPSPGSQSPDAKSTEKIQETLNVTEHVSVEGKAETIADTTKESAVDDSFLAAGSATETDDTTAEKPDGFKEVYDYSHPFAIKGFPTELRETHITTVGSTPEREHLIDLKVIDKVGETDDYKYYEETSLNDIKEEDEEDRLSLQSKSPPGTAKSSPDLPAPQKLTIGAESVELPRAASPREEEVLKIVANVAVVLKSAKDISEIVPDFDEEELDRKLRLSPRPDDADQEQDDAEQESATVQRMLVTASSEDGGEETEICAQGTIIFSPSSTTPEFPSRNITPDIVIDVADEGGEDGATGAGGVDEKGSEDALKRETEAIDDKDSTHSTPEPTAPTPKVEDRGSRSSTPDAKTSPESVDEKEQHESSEKTQKDTSSVESSQPSEKPTEVKQKHEFEIADLSRKESNVSDVLEIIDSRRESAISTFSERDYTKEESSFDDKYSPPGSICDLKHDLAPSTRGSIASIDEKPIEVASSPPKSSIVTAEIHAITESESAASREQRSGNDMKSDIDADSNTTRVESAASRASERPDSVLSHFSDASEPELKEKADLVEKATLIQTGPIKEVDAKKESPQAEPTEVANIESKSEDKLHSRSSSVQSAKSDEHSINQPIQSPSDVKISSQSKSPEANADEPRKSITAESTLGKSPSPVDNVITKSPALSDADAKSPTPSTQSTAEDKASASPTPSLLKDSTEKGIFFYSIYNHFSHSLFNIRALFTNVRLIYEIKLHFSRYPFHF